jgi:hypothetical protein
MRHRGLASTSSIGLLPLAMMLLACFRSLISAARRPQLLLTHTLPTCLLAIALTAITTGTDGKKCVAGGIKTPAQSKTFYASISLQCF